MSYKIVVINNESQKQYINQFINELKILHQNNTHALPKNYNLNNINKGHVIELLCNEKRFFCHNAGFIVLYNGDELVSAAGYHPYNINGKDGHIVLSRFFINKPYRGKNNFIVDDYLFPHILKQNVGPFLWMTMNEDRENLYNSFIRCYNKKSSFLGSPYPKSFRGFVPIGIHNIFYTKQFVVEKYI